jgi:hypothetical protein
MAHPRDTRPALAPWILETYARLCAHLTGDHEEPTMEAASDAPSIAREEAVALLCGVDDVTRTDVDYALTRLLERGYVYEVNDELRVTDLADRAQHR